MDYVCDKDRVPPIIASRDKNLEQRISRRDDIGNKGCTIQVPVKLLLLLTKYNEYCLHNT